MQPLRTYLERAFRRGLDLPADSISLVQDSSAKGQAKGLWARPDFILVSAMRFKFMPGAQVDVHSFELRTETGCSVLSVHEALAQTRFTHFGHLVWHLPENSKSEARLAEIEDHCDEHGIGLIRMREPLASKGCEILADPVRKSTLPMAVEGFLETRLSVEQKDSLARRVGKILMAGKLIAVANMKGGVGKTTTVVSLAEALAADNPSASTLVVDLDPQASASVCLAGDKLLTEMIEDGRTVESFIEDRLIKGDGTELAPKIHKNVSCTTQGGNQLKISLLPCGPDLRVVEREIIYSLNERGFNMRGIEGQTWKLFEQEFQPLGKTYDYVIFDCPPGISPLSEVAIRASDLVIVPTIPDFISVYGINGLLRVFWRERPKGAFPPPKLKPHVLVTKFLTTVRQHRDYVELLEKLARKDPQICLFKTKVQHAAALARAMGNIDEAPTLNQKHPPFIQKYGGDVTKVLTQLVQELKGVLHGD